VSSPLPHSKPNRASSLLTGELTFEVLTPSSNGTAVLVGRLSGANAQAKQLMGERVEAPFLAKVNSRCEVTAFAHHKDTVRPVARVQDVVLNDLAFAIPRGELEEVQFHTTIGTQRALVARDQESGQFLRKALSYNARWLPSMASVDVVAGEVHIRRGSGPWFDGLKGTEEVRGGAVDASTTEWEVTSSKVDGALLTGVSRRESDYVWANVLGDDENAPEVKLLGDDKEHQRYVELMSNVSYEQAIVRFSALLERGANINEQWPAMAGYLDAHPDKIGEYVELITDESFPDGAKAPAFLVLAQTRSPVARESLLGMYRDRAIDPANRMRSSLALVSRADVGAPLARELRVEASRSPENEAEAAVSRQAVLHLGMLSGTRPTQEDIVIEATDLVSELASKAKTPHDYSVLCGAVGNMADPRQLPRVAQWSQIADPDIRMQVPHALRRYKIDAVSDLVENWLARETDQAVNRELFNIIRHMHVDEARQVSPQIAAAALKHLKENPPVLNRQSLFHILAPSVGTNLDVREVFKTQLKVELTERSGLYSLVAAYLPAESQYEVLATVPGMSGQFGGGIEPLLPQPEPRGQEVPIPQMQRAMPGDYAPGTLGGEP